MSRKRIYRGKPTQDYDIISQIWKSYYKDGFIYGSLLEKDNKIYICVAIQCKLNCYVNNAYVSLIEVIPETVGQYTGLNDKNGNKIFEGDTLKFINSDNETSYYDVVYSETDCRWIIRQNGIYEDVLDKFVERYMTVVGNIYDNPKLLEV